MYYVDDCVIKGEFDRVWFVYLRVLKCDVN